MKPLRSWLSRLFAPTRPDRRRVRRKTFRPQVEVLELRLAPSTFTVLNTLDSGAGSLRQAILDANAAAGADLINFNIPTYSAANDFSLASNPNRVWSYGYSNTLGGNLNLYDVARMDGQGRPGSGSERSVPGIDAWSSSALGVDPNVIHNRTNTDISWVGLTLPANSLMFHPGPSGQDSVVRWTAPSNTAIDLSVGFSGLTSTSTDVHVLKNGTSLFDGRVSGFGPGPTFTKSLNVTAGDLIDFVVGDGGNGYSSDSTGLNATITTVAGSGVHTISPLSPLPTITDPVTIDGYTQAGARPNTLAQGNDAVLQIELSGASAGTEAVGLNITAGNSTVRGLVINHFAGTPTSSAFYAGTGILLQTGGGNVIEGNFIGTNAAGTASLGNRIGIRNASTTGSTLGGTSPAARNLISGNQRTGVLLEGPQTLVQGNFIGTDVTGTVAVRNGSGFYLDAGVTVRGHDQVLGGTTPGAGNLISGNDLGVAADGTGHQVLGNLIGTDVTGMKALGNYNQGISLDFATNNTIARNIISGNTYHGIGLGHATGNRIQGNYIGLDIAGSAPLGNSNSGVFLLYYAESNVIGTDGDGVNDAAEGNVISANQVGVDFYNIDPRIYRQNVVAGNRIGTNAAGTAIIGNYFSGVHVNGASVRIGTNGDGVSDALEGNVIAGSGQGRDGRGSPGVLIQGPEPAVGNSIRGNAIFANSGLGIDLWSPPYGYPSVGDGVTLNDPGDADTGPNNLQNFPVISAVTTGATTRVAGTLNSTANTTFTLDFYANTTVDPSCHGEGERWLGSATVTTDASGNASFDVTLAAPTSASEEISATATDPAGNTSEFSAVLNLAPVVGAISAPLDPIQTNTTINVSANFSDHNTCDTHTAVWNWGDATTSAGAVTETNGSGSVTGSHTYTAAGVYTLTLTVTDSQGASGQAVFQYVVVYDASAGFVTGGGWINSPAGAYTPDPALTGKASFGFVAKYLPGQSTPSGNTEFDFKVANFNFKSTSYDWLVVAGAKAQYKGTGTVNGSGSYNFMLTAIDGDLPGGGGVDKFRIKISGPGGVLYDNQTGAGDDANPTTTLGGGSITIHKSALHVLGGMLAGAAGSDILTPQALQPLVAEAIARWQSAGAAPEDLNALRQVNALIADLPNSHLGLASPGTIWIDQDAAGYGWFIDASPADDVEFPATTDSPAQGKIDLLTVLEHEFGHALGLEHEDEGVMGEYLAVGIRRVPVPGAGVPDGILYALGAGSDDHVTINPQGNGLLQVHTNFFPEGNFRTCAAAGAAQIIVVLCDGDDLLIGGLGADRLVGNGGDDLRLGGYTAFDTDSAGLDLVLSEWASPWMMW